MPGLPLNRICERRIEQEIVVDAYGPEEHALSWYYYLEEKLSFPFAARCVAKHPLWPLKKGERVEVLGMARENMCLQGMFVLARHVQRRFGVPLELLEPVGVGAEARTAIVDWHYWVRRGYSF